MSGVPYHAWTHRPKAQGGTDPIEVEVASPAIEWITVTSSDPWADTGTIIDFGVFNGNWTGTTFDINGDDNLTIGKGGLYTIHTDFHGVPVDPSGTAWSHIHLDYEKIAGPGITGTHSSWLVGFSVIKCHITPNDPIGPQGNSLNFFHDTFEADMEGDYSTPMEFQFTGLLYWDGLAVNSNPFLLRHTLVRHGDTLL